MWILPGDLYGVGQYASDSWEIFIMDNVPPSPDMVEDKILKQYVKEYNDGLISA